MPLPDSFILSQRDRTLHSCAGLRRVSALPSTCSDGVEIDRGTSRSVIVGRSTSWEPRSKRLWQRFRPQTIDQRRSEPEATVPKLPSKESNETYLIWACTLCACILQPITFLVRILSFWTPLASACAIDYAIFGSTSLFDAEPSHYGLGNLPLAFALVYSRLLVSFVLTLIYICLKWLLVGRLRPTDAPHRWPVLAHFRWRSGRIIHTQLEPALECFRGTAILNYILRALGARVHRSATIESTQIFDWDLVELGPHTVLQERASISAVHLHLCRTFGLSVS